jgi:predicted CXXCH cytochrome family protein
MLSLSRVATAFVLGLLIAVPVARAEECLDCHDRSSAAVSVHQPYQDNECTACHGEHPEDGGLVLNEKGSALCAQCHGLFDDDYKRAHQGLTAGKVDCLSCHNPHASSAPKLARPATYLHRPLVSGDCAACHKEGGALRATSTMLLCGRCHDVSRFQGISRHAPVADGDCTACHDPHGSRYPWLLVSRHPPNRLAPFEAGTYELCFTCHDADAFATPGPEADTKFKDSRDNLHYRHVVKRGGSSTGKAAPDGLSCRNCHFTHAAPQPRLIRQDLISDGVLFLKLNFKIEGGKATCSAGCHQSSSYVSEGAVAAAQPTATVLPSTEGTGVATGGFGVPGVKKSGCPDCHAERIKAFGQAENQHAPVRKGRCDDCHADHGEVPKLALIAQEGRLCSRCHAASGEKFTTAHGGLDASKGGCVSCHDPHASAAKGLLQAVQHDPFSSGSCGDCHDGTSARIDRPINELCGDCHEEQGSMKFLHQATTEKTCVSCHDPHGSKWAKVLKSEDPGLCYQCHDRKKFDLAWRHQPVSDGDCSSCHDPHGSSRPNLLVAAYPSERYQDFRSEDSQLCFECHGEESFRDMASTDTSFRDDSVNYHQLHVNTQVTERAGIKKSALGATCRNCHEPHATDQPRLIRRELDCGGVPCLNLEFKMEGETGKCARGCHTPKNYTPSK